MGSGSSSSRVQRFDKGNQAPSRSETKPYAASSTCKPLAFECISFKPIKRQMSTQDDLFQLDPNIEEYASIWDHETKLSSTFQQSIRSSRPNLEHDQKETLDDKRSKKTSAVFDSARIESTIDTETHRCINLSSSDKIDDLIADLNRIHTEVDDIIKRRTEKVSTETESLLSHILNETHQKQQRLLNYAKDQQSKSDEHYRKLLQAFISELDQIKAKDLADLQKKMQNYREKILEESQVKIMTVNDQANLTKAKILKEEQQKSADKIDSIIAQLQQISGDEKLQHLGSESITRTHITTNTNVGTKAPGQHSTINFDHIDPPEQRPQANVREGEKITKRVSITQRPKLQS